MAGMAVFTKGARETACFEVKKFVSLSVRPSSMISPEQECGLEFEKVNRGPCFHRKVGCTASNNNNKIYLTISLQK